MISKMSKWVLVGVVVLAGTAQLGTAAVITVGQSGADYTSFSAAVNAVTSTYSTIRFIDSATYNEAGQPSLTAAKYEGLTIESAASQKATVNFTGSGGYDFNYGRTNMTLQNIKIVNSGRDTGFLGDGNATNLVVKGVDFVNNVSGSGNYLMGATPGMNVSYCTFRGYSSGSTGGPGISVYLGTGVPFTVNHCSFDNLGFAPIKNGVGAAMTVTNSAFGAYNGAINNYKAAIYVAGTLNEDYNASYMSNLIYSEVAPNYPQIGAHSFYVSGGYTSIFTGNTANGDWTVGASLLNAASDGTAIGVPEPTTLAVLLMGTIVSLFNRRRK